MVSIVSPFAIIYFALSAFRETTELQELIIFALALAIGLVPVAIQKLRLWQKLAVALCYLAGMGTALLLWGFMVACGTGRGCL